MPYDNWLQALLPHFKEAFSRALQELLEEKNLCQSVLVDLNFIKPWAFSRTEGNGHDLHQPGSYRTGTEDADPSAGAHILKAIWYPEGCSFAVEEFYTVPGSRTRYSQAYSFPLPQIKWSCPECQDRTLFKPDLPQCRFVTGKNAGDEHSLLLSYECHECRNRRVNFLVSRNGDRLQLSGRDAIELPPIPHSVPAAVADYYRQAQIAHRGGQNLAAFVLMREFIEQFWRSLPEMQEPLSRSARMTAAEIGEYYSAQLPLEFKAQYPSLVDCHRWLDDAIHGPASRQARFEYCLRDIVEHLDGRRFRRLSTFSAPPFEEARAV